MAAILDFVVTMAVTLLAGLACWVIAVAALSTRRMPADYEPERRDR